MAKGFIDSAVTNRQTIAISSITLAELVYLVEKARLQPSSYERLSEALADHEHVFTEVSLTSAIVEFMRSVPRDEVPDMPDRIIAATALYLRVPIISRDRQIRGALMQTVW